MKIVFSQMTLLEIKDNFRKTTSYIKPSKTYIPKNMYQTKRGKWVSYK